MLALDSTNAFLAVLMLWIIISSLIRHITNQAVWKYACLSMLLYPNTNQNIINAIESITDDVIPITFINFDMPLVFYFLGFLKNSSSTLSYGIPIWEKS